MGIFSLGNWQGTFISKVHRHLRERLSFILPRALIRIKYIYRKSLYPNVKTILVYNRPKNFSAEVRYKNCYPFDVLRVFKFLRMMDLSSIELFNVPAVIEFLLELRYVALCIEGHNHDSAGDSSSPIMTISLRRHEPLETLIIQCENMDSTYLPHGILELYRLRHLHLKGHYYNRPQLDNLQTLSHLQTLSLPFSFVDCEEILKVAPNLRKLYIHHTTFLYCTTLTISILPSSIFRKFEFANLSW